MLRTLAVLFLTAIPTLGDVFPHTAPTLMPLCIQAGSAPSRKGENLDTLKIRALYMDGDFEEAISLLEYARTNKQITTHVDSVFVYKHLGVMYAAKYESMEKGKQYMFQLLTIEPTVRIMDMYASDMIYMIFRNVQAEYEIRHARPNDTGVVHSNQTESGKGKSRPKISKTHTWPYWTAGAVALTAGVGLATFFLWEGDPSAPTRYEGNL
jgi:hypothetical protein